MSRQRDIRRLTMQALYQLDVRGASDREAIDETVREAPGGAKLGDIALELAEKVWAVHGQADQAIQAVAPQWPTYRQPRVDRALLRLAWYEMATDRAPTKVVINEAIELSKVFCSEESPAFINAVLDRLAREKPTRTSPPDMAAPPTPGARAAEVDATSDPWLADATSDQPGDAPNAN